MNTDATTAVMPLHPFQDDLNFDKDQQQTAKATTTAAATTTTTTTAMMNNSTPDNNNNNTSPCSSLSTITSLSSSSSSSMKPSRLSLPSIWSNSQENSSSSVWSYYLDNTLPTSPNSTDYRNQHSSLLSQQFRRPSSLYQPLMDQYDTPDQSSYWSDGQPRHPLRNIWSTGPVEQQESHQRRSSLSEFPVSSPWSSLLSETQHDAESGRRHSVAGPFMKKPTLYNANNNMQGWVQDNTQQFYPGMTTTHRMKAIDENDLYANTLYSRQQQLILNKGVLDHIDEYFGGSGGTGKAGRMTDVYGSNTNPFYRSNEYPYQYQHVYGPTPATVPLANQHYGKTMTAGGDAATFGCSTVLMGKGIPLHHFLDSNTMLYTVEFKAGRTDICYIMQGDNIEPQVGDLVIVEADRGRDIGKVTSIQTANDIMKHHHQQDRATTTTDRDSTVGSTGSSSSVTGDATAVTDDNTMDKDVQTGITSDVDAITDSILTTDILDKPSAGDEEKEDETRTTAALKCHVKRLYRLADADEVISLATKQLDEEKALLVCQTKIQQKQLPMQVVNAEYQWDRRKLTFYFLADQRIDFRELVRELFKTYKTRIWMCALNSNSSNGASTNE